LQTSLGDPRQSLDPAVRGDVTEANQFLAESSLFKQSLKCWSADLKNERSAARNQRVLPILFVPINEKAALPVRLLDIFSKLCSRLAD